MNFVHEHWFKQMNVLDIRGHKVKYCGECILGFNGHMAVYGSERGRMRGIKWGRIQTGRRGGVLRTMDD